jgi:uncharacterized protein (TIGR00730 family)
MHRICVFAGSRDGGPRYAEAASAVGAGIAHRGWGLVYGGAGVGTMKVLADAALSRGGEVLGVLPRRMIDREIAHQSLTKLLVVGSMHERKATMHDRSNAFLVLPGGFGTLDEAFEAITWRQLALHSKPIALLDVDGFFQPLVAWIDRAVADGFFPAEHARALLVDRDPERLLDALAP